MFPRLKDLKMKISSTSCLGMPHPKGQIVLITDDGLGCRLLLTRIPLSPRGGGGSEAEKSLCT